MFQLKKEEFEKIELAFEVLKETPNSTVTLKIIEESLNKCFGYHFTVSVVPNITKQLFVMSVFPEESTIDKIIVEIMKSGNSSKIVKQLWQKNDSWNVEIDEMILDKNVIDLTKRELTACLLHEVGHVIYSNSIYERAITIMKYEISQQSVHVKAMGGDKIFRKIFSLPILTACIGNYEHSNDSLKQEVKADKFAIKMGYEADLVSVLKKFIQCSNYPKNGSMNSNISKTTRFSAKTLDNFRLRNDALVKRSLSAIRDESASPTIRESANDIYESLFKFEYAQAHHTPDDKIDVMVKRANDLTDKYYTEFFTFKHNLKRIDPSQIDYCVIKENNIKSDIDRMMIVSYIHEKLEMIEYYISIYENPSYLKKYNIPNSLEQLHSMKKTLLSAKEKAMNMTFKDTSTYYVSYPDGYTG